MFCILLNEAGIVLHALKPSKDILTEIELACQKIIFTETFTV